MSAQPVDISDALYACMRMQPLVPEATQPEVRPRRVYAGPRGSTRVLTGQ